jgi:hypothetical protein
MYQEPIPVNPDECCEDCAELHLGSPLDKVDYCLVRDNMNVLLKGTCELWRKKYEQEK